MYESTGTNFSHVINSDEKEEKLSDLSSDNDSGIKLKSDKS